MNDDVPTRRRILDELKRMGPRTAAQLARRLRVTPMAVRQHLARLEAEGLVAFEDVRGGVGRPARTWSLTPDAQRVFPDAHADLAVGMIDAARAAFGAAGMERLVERRTDAQERAYLARIEPGTPLDRRVARLAAIRREEGYMAEWRRERDGSFTLIENHCPICVAARACMGLCAGEQRLFERVLGPGVDVERREHILSGDRRCLYRIAARG